MQTYQNPINTCDFYNLDSHNRVGGGGRYKFRTLILAQALLTLAFLFLLASCAYKPQYINDSSDYTSFGIDYHDIEMMIDDIVASFLSSDFVKNLEGKKVLVISDIENLTDEDIDIELLSRKLIRQIRNSKKFTLTNAIAGSGSKTDKMIRESRKLRNDEEYNQYTTKEKGNLVAPDYSLSGKITQRTKSIGKKVRVDYQFLLVLSDLKKGVVLWDNEEIISKVIAKEKLQEYKDEDSSIAHNQSYYTPNNAYAKSYSPTKEKIKDFFRNTKDNAKGFFSFGPNGKNHIVFGADIGVINYALYRVSITTDSGLGLGFPITVRAGYERDIGEKWALGANFVYIINSIFPISDGSSMSDYGSERLGFEMVGGYKIGNNKTLYTGFGLSKDINSYVTSFNGGYYKLNTLYPLLKLGVMWYAKPAVGLSWELNYGWAIDKQNYINTGIGLMVLGIQFRI
ncbi:penicillin-binding protein activator LpoB [Helicobacter sp. T3_23-1056]